MKFINSSAIKTVLFTLTLMLSSLVLISCDDGKAENAGEKIDNAIEDAGDSIEEAANDTGRAIEDACEEVSDEACN